MILSAILMCSCESVPKSIAPKSSIDFATGTQLADRLKDANDNLYYRRVSNTKSMWPFIDENSILIFKPMTNPNEVKVGEVVEFLMPEINRFVVHQVTAVSDKAFLSAGYNSQTPDGWHDLRLIMGKMVAVIYTEQKPKELKERDDKLSESIEYSAGRNPMNR